MNQMLKRLMQRARLMAEHDEENNGGASREEDFDVKIEGEDEEEPENKKPENEEGDKGGEKPNNADGEKDEEDEHEDVEPAPEGETEEEKRERRRKERQDRKVRQREREEATKRELANERRARQELERRIAEIEGRDRSRDLAQIDEGIARAARVYDIQKRKYEEAIEQHDGNAAAVAQEKMLEAREADRQLKQMKAAAEQSQKSNNRPTTLDPVLVNHAQNFMERNRWYRHGGQDTDSRIVAVLDQEVAEAGYNPNTQEYWDELDARIKKHLPHRVAGGKVQPDKSQPPRQNKSVVGGSGGGSTASGKAVFVLSKERVQALKDAGMWDDPDARAKAIKSYRDFDKANKKG